MNPDKLTRIGLTQQQAKVYLKLLESGPSTVGRLIKQMDIARISCYDTLNRLVSRGLVSYVQTRGNRQYQATGPAKLLHMAEEKEQEAKKQKEGIKEMLPRLTKIERLGRHEDKEASIYKTKEGIKSLFELMLKEGKTIYVTSATGKALQEMRFYFPQWHKQRVKLKIPVKIIFNSELKDRKITKIPFSETRFLPKEFSSPSTLFIFGGYVATLLWSDMPFAFLIKSREIAESYGNYFRMIWKTAKR